MNKLNGTHQNKRDLMDKTTKQTSQQKLRDLGALKNAVKSAAASQTSSPAEFADWRQQFFFVIFVPKCCSLKNKITTTTTTQSSGFIFSSPFVFSCLLSTNYSTFFFFLTTPPTDSNVLGCFPTHHSVGRPGQTL